MYIEYTQRHASNWLQYRLLGVINLCRSKSFPTNAGLVIFYRVQLHSLAERTIAIIFSALHHISYNCVVLHDPHNCLLTHLTVYTLHLNQTFFSSLSIGYMVWLALAYEYRYSPHRLRFKCILYVEKCFQKVEMRYGSASLWSNMCASIHWRLPDMIYCILV